MIITYTCITIVNVWKKKAKAAFLWFHMRNLSLAGYNCSGGVSCMACSFIGRLLSVEIKVSGIKCLFNVLLVIGYASIPRHRPKTSGRNIWPVASNLTSRIHRVVEFHLIVLEFGCSTVETEKQTHIIWKQIYISASNINVIISGTTAIVRVQFVDLWATNNTFHQWLNWTPRVNWYALKIRPRNSEIEQHFS